MSKEFLFVSICATVIFNFYPSNGLIRSCAEL